MDSVLPFETKKPSPNKNKEYTIIITPCTDGKIQIYDISMFLDVYSGRNRDSQLNRVTHEIHGKTATVYIIDHYELVNRKQAIKLAEKFINGDFDTYRLD